MSGRCPNCGRLDAKAGAVWRCPACAQRYAAGHRWWDMEAKALDKKLEAAQKRAAPDAAKGER